MSYIFTDENFQTEAVEASKTKPVLVDFFATWCGPCQMQAPIMDEVAEAMGDKAVVGKVDVDVASQVAGSYNVMSIPTLIILRDGKEAKRFIGVESKNDLINELNSLI